MKKTNKGFSMVELIIVIAIMAILAGALAPALIKYINKSKLSSDIQAGQTVAKAIETALANESAFDELSSDFSLDYNQTNMSKIGACWAAECQSVCAWSKAKSKAKKDMNGTALTPGDFKVKVSIATNSVEVYLQDGTTMVYPTPDKKLSEKTQP